MIYAPERGGSGAPIYTYHLIKSLAKNLDEKEKPGIVFSAHHSYKNPENTFYNSHPIYFDRPPIFDDQPKVPHSIAFKDMTKKQIKENIRVFYDEFKKRIQEEKYDLMHVQHGMYIGYAASLIKKDLNIPYTITLHVMELNFLHEFPDPILAMKAMTDADRIVALTEAQKKRLLNEYSKEKIIKLESEKKSISLDEAKKKYHQIIGDTDIDPGKITVCALGIDTELFDILPDKQVKAKVGGLGIPEDAQVVFYAGRLIDMKGIKHLLDAEPIYNRSGEIHTLILGGGELEDYVKKIAKERPSVHYPGFVEQENMVFYHNFAAIHNGVFCVPSSSEGFSLVVLEALATGVRTVVCCKRDMGDLDVMEYPNAIFAKFGDKKDVAKKIIKMLNLQLKSSLESRQKIRKSMSKYNKENLYKLVAEVYTDVLKSYSKT